MLRQNIAANELVIRHGGGSIVAFPLVWGETEMKNVEEAWRMPNIVLAADVVYHRELFEPLLQTLRDIGESISPIHNPTFLFHSSLYYFESYLGSRRCSCEQH